MRHHTFLTPGSAALAALLFILLPLPSVGTSLLIANGQIDPSVPGPNSLGHSDWDTFTAVMHDAFPEIDSVSILDDLGLMLQYDAIWVERGRFLGDGSEALSALEIANLQAFAETGRRMVMIGENVSNYELWDESVVDVVGGSLAGNVNVPAFSVADHELTDGVTSIGGPGPPLALGNLTGAAAVGGTPLFDPSVATLWGDNVLTILDTAPFDDWAWDEADNSQFAGNVAGWLSTPEPTTALLVGLGLAGLAMRGRWLN